MKDSLACLSPTMINSVFCGVEFKFHTSHPVLDTCETLSKLSKMMVGDIEIGNDTTERGSIEGKKKGAQDKALGHTIWE